MCRMCVDFFCTFGAFCGSRRQKRSYPTLTFGTAYLAASHSTAITICNARPSSTNPVKVQRKAPLGKYGFT
jgi:hypothetical protein